MAEIIKDLACARKNFGDARHAYLILLGAPGSLRWYESVGEPISSLFSYNGPVNSLIFGVHCNLLQIVLCRCHSLQTGHRVE